VSPVIVWQDNRTKPMTDQLRGEGGEAITLAKAGLPLDPYFSASKLAWILANIPEAQTLQRQGALRLGTTDAFFLDRLAGSFVTDATTASRTSLMNLETGDWDPELCRLFGVPLEALPPIVPTAGLKLGAIGKVPVTASVVDQQAALYGHGCRRPGDAKITFGTGAFALAITGSEIVRAPEMGLLPTIAWRTPKVTQYAVDGGVYDAGSAIEWLKRLQLFERHAELDHFTGPPAITRDLIFVPALSGLACPYWDRTASGLWIGLTADTTKADLCRAALEGIAFLTSNVIAALRGRIKIAEPISIDGGLIGSGYFTDFLASVLGQAVRKQAFSELTAFGCAGLAALALGAEDKLQGPLDAAKVASPAAADTSGWQAKFDDAVKRARGWRTGSPD
jgi:glycerol kinase